MAARAHRCQEGFTLLEMLVVVGVLSILLGLGIGFLRRGGTERGAALSAIAGQLRAAASIARGRGLPTEVLLLPGADGGAATVQTLELLPVAVFHLEPDDRGPADDLRPALAGADVLAGRFGHGRRAADDQAPVLRLPVPRSRFDLRGGFVFRLDLLLEGRKSAALLRLGRSLELTLDEQGAVRARMVQRDVEGRAGAAALLAAPTALPLLRWVTLELVHDGRELWCSVDGEVVARTDAASSLHQQDEDLLELSPADLPVAGVVDELQWLIYGWSDPVRLPAGVAVPAVQRLRLGADGEPSPPASFRLLLEREGITETLAVGPGGVLR